MIYPTKYKVIFMIVVLFPLFFAGCSKFGKSYPKCDSKDVLDTVYRITASRDSDITEGDEQALQAIINYEKYEVNSIVYTEKNKELRKCSCKGMLSYNVPKPIQNGNNYIEDYGNPLRKTKEIEYSAQFSEDGSILVEVNTETLPDFLIRKDLINKSPSKSPEQLPTPAPPEPEQTPEQLNH